jgi:hypothetical protein
MTPATTVTPNSPSASNSDTNNPTWIDTARNTFVEIIAVFKRSPEWIVIIFAWFSAGVLPAYWFIGDDHLWSESDSLLFMQPFVPLFVGALLWHDRERLNEAWSQTSRSKRHGAPWLLWIGCLLILSGHFVHVLTYTALGLVVAAVGVAYLAYGGRVLKQAALPLAVGILMVPPPLKVISIVTNLYSAFLMKGIVKVLQLASKPVFLTLQGDNSVLDMAGHSIDIPSRQVAALGFTAFFMIVYAVWRREKLGSSLVTIAFASLFAALLTFVVPIIALLLPITPVTIFFARIPPLIVAVLATTTAILFKRRLRALGEGLASSGRVISKISDQAQKVTERAADGVTRSVGSRTSRTGRSVNKGTEAIIDGFVRFVSKPFKRKRKNHW